MLHTEKNTINGTTVSIVRLKIGNRTAVYKTENGKVTATDGKGNPLPPEDDFFGVNGNPPSVTGGPSPSALPETTKAPLEETTEADRKTEAPSGPATTETPEMKSESPAPPERTTRVGTS
ncbi:unnamed protein product [Cylicostephanus goldi]|uniref:Uncharacterized protein n=1 Tax=Cylicostephanus goldi TaxID=71465 RepID=A0A3P6RP70_CYLGO|nr:unnamed protein product [Cylicostephanus goldi]